MNYPPRVFHEITTQDKIDERLGRTDWRARYDSMLGLAVRLERELALVQKSSEELRRALATRQDGAVPTEALRTDGVEIVGTLKRGPGEYDERPFYYFSAPGVIPGLHVAGSSLYGVLSGILHVWRDLYEHAPLQVPDPDADDPPSMNSVLPK